LPPVIVIDSPDIDDTFCGQFTVEGSAFDEDSGIEEITLYIDGEEIEAVELDRVHRYDFEFDVSQSDFPPDCHEEEVEVVARDAEENESSEGVDVFLCDDSTAPVVIAIAEEDVLTSEVHCTIVLVHIVEENLEGYEVSDIAWGTENEFEFEVCGSDLEIGDNTISVVAWDICGNEGSGVITVTYVPNNPPYEPSNPYPSMGSEDVELDVVFSWVGGDPDGDEVLYDFYIGYDMSHLMLAGENLDVPSFSFDGVLDEHTPFFWKVVCKDNEYDVEGPIWSFVTGP